MTQSAPFARPSSSRRRSQALAVDRDPRLRTRLRADRDRCGASRDCNRHFARSCRRSQSRLRAYRDRRFARSRRRSQSRLRADRDRRFARSHRRSRSREAVRCFAIDGAVVGLELTKHRVVEPRRSRASIWVLCLFFWFCLFPCSIFQTPENIFRKIF